jgi:hypothetical protein
MKLVVHKPNPAEPGTFVTLTLSGPGQNSLALWTSPFKGENNLVTLTNGEVHIAVEDIPPEGKFYWV